MGREKIPESWTEVIRNAEARFWEAIADGTPDATTGDLAPEVAIRFREECDSAARAWYDENVRDSGVRALLERLAADLWALRTKYNLGDGNEATPNANVAAAIAESLASWCSRAAEDGDFDSDTLNGMVNGMPHNFSEYLMRRAAIDRALAATAPPAPAPEPTFRPGQYVMCAPGAGEGTPVEALIVVVAEDGTIELEDFHCDRWRIPPAQRSRLTLARNQKRGA